MQHIRKREPYDCTANGALTDCAECGVTRSVKWTPVYYAGGFMGLTMVCTRGCGRYVVLANTIP